TVWDARVGQKATITAIAPDYKTGLIFRGDTVPKGRFFWQKERMTSYGVLDTKVKDMVKDAFKGQKITQRDDIPFNVKEVTDVEVDADLATTPMGGRESGERNRGKAFAEAAAPPAPSPQTPAPILADVSGDLKLSGKVIDGKHTVAVQVGDVPPEVEQ